MSDIVTSTVNLGGGLIIEVIGNSLRVSNGIDRVWIKIERVDEFIRHLIRLTCNECGGTGAMLIDYDNHGHPFYEDCDCIRHWFLDKADPAQEG